MTESGVDAQPRMSVPAERNKYYKMIRRKFDGGPAPDFRGVMLKRISIGVLDCVLSAGMVFGQSDPMAMPAKDQHEGLLIAAEPYEDGARYKPLFGKKNPYDVGLVAIEAFFRNDNDRPIQVDLESVRLLLEPPGTDRQRLKPLTVDQVTDRILLKGGPNPTTRRKPIPVPGRGPNTGRGKEWDQLYASLNATAFNMDVLPPRSTVHGFLFFDLDSHYDWLKYARLYIPDLKFPNSNKVLLYFEVDLAPALRH